MFWRKERRITLDSALVSEKCKHIAFIMDGNGRYATRRGLPREAGHAEGARNFRRAVEHCFSLGIKTVTVYAFSTENWKRPEQEVSALMKLFFEYMTDAFSTCKEKSIRVVFLGDKGKFADSLRETAERLEKDTSDGEYTLNIALNYGARSEITHAVNLLLAEKRESVAEEDISSHLYTAGSPDPDLVVRTGGDMRISNFLLWQSAYAEYYFTETLWPELTSGEIDRIVFAFLNRDRRYGGLSRGKNG